MNLIDDKKVKTINIWNIVEQLNDITNIIRKGGNSNLSEIQLKNLNESIDNLKDKLNNLETDVNKYIDETELTEALKNIKLSLENIVKINELNEKLKDYAKLKDNNEFVNNNNFKKVSTTELNSNIINSNIYKINSDEVIKKDNNNNNTILGIDNNITTLKGTDLYFNNNKVEFNKFVKENDLSKYAKLDENNIFTGKIIGKEFKLDSIETNSLKVGGKNVVTDTSNFAKLNTTNDFTQKIKGTEIESNKLITDELLLNGVNVNLSDYTTNNNLISQVEKIIGLVYGGNVQDSGSKTVGKFYFDSINNYFYECILNNNLTYIDNSKFRPISNKPINDKIYNNDLLNIKFYTKNDLLDFDRDLNSYIQDINLIIYGKLAICSGYMKDIGNQLLDIKGKLCSFPVKSKYNFVWFNNNFMVTNIEDKCTLIVGGYYTYSKKNTPFHFQGVFMIE